MGKVQSQPAEWEGDPAAEGLMVDCQAVLQRIAQCYLGVEFVTLLCRLSQ